jgi:hypothetical protein
MKSMMIAAAAVLGLGIGSAYADGGESPIPNTFFTELPGVIAQAPVQQAPAAVAANQNGAEVNIFATSHRPAGTWLFPVDQTGGGNN